MGYAKQIHVPVRMDHVMLWVTNNPQPWWLTEGYFLVMLHVQHELNRGFPVYCSHSGTKAVLKDLPFEDIVIQTWALGFATMEKASLGESLLQNASTQM